MCWRMNCLRLDGEGFPAKGTDNADVGKPLLPLISPRKKLWGGAFWSPSYFAGSCGCAPIEVVRQYIKQQQTPH
ncbi:hypothetical protein CNECB9_4920017 [Cupriavidus necator]|uniref:Transposase IS200-like domain-containing protein n=1 Tax=Cupriavidus necator TaxID=106590 RepID=A0A1K0JUT3_CUPNE|nr:hypothetical protein CNECB9_4920017 [Cupriavidus necator]